MQNPTYKNCEAQALRSAGYLASGSNIIQAFKKCIQWSHTHCDVDNFQTCYDYQHTFEAVQNDVRHRSLTHDRTVKRIHQRSQCLQRLRKVVDTCSDIQEAAECEGHIRAVKVIRLTMDTVGSILARDKSVKVVHLLRDPHGIVNSRSKVRLLSRLRRNSGNALKTEAQFLCHKIMEDIRVRKQLEYYFPDNFLEITYESIAQFPLEKYKDVYSFLGMKPSTDVENWIVKSTNASENTKQAAYGTMRHNSTATALSWMKELSENAIQDIDIACYDVIKYLEKLEL